MDTDKREKVFRNVEQFFGIPERSFLVSNLTPLNEEEMEQLIKETPNVLDDNNGTDNEKDAIIEKSKEIIESIQSEFEKKEN